MECTDSTQLRDRKLNPFIKSYRLNSLLEGVLVCAITLRSHCEGLEFLSERRNTFKLIRLLGGLSP